jgi:hypothetical protein
MSTAAIVLILTYILGWVECLFCGYAVIGLLTLLWVFVEQKLLKEKMLWPVASLAAGLAMLFTLDGFRAHWDARHGEHFPLLASYGLLALGYLLLGSGTFRLAKHCQPPKGKT